MKDQFKKIETLDDLIIEAGEETELKMPQAQLRIDTAPEKPTESKEVVEDTVENNGESEIEEGESTVKVEMTPKLLKSNSEFLLSMVDIAQKSAFGFGLKLKYKKKITKLYGVEGLDIAESVEDKEIADLTGDEIPIKRINKKYETVMDSLKMTQEEREMWYPLVEEYVKKNHGKIPDNFYNYLALAQSLGARFIAVLTF